MSTIYKCDRCGLECCDFELKKVNKMDLCEDCKSELDEVISKFLTPVKIEEQAAPEKKLKDFSHAGEVLWHEFMQINSLSVVGLSKDTGIPKFVIEHIITFGEGITPEIDAALSKALGTSEGFWLNLQVAYDAEEKLVRRKCDKCKYSHSIYPCTSCSIESDKFKPKD